MDDLYGYKLFLKNDIVRAFNYVAHDTLDNKIDEMDTFAFNSIVSEKNGASTIIIMANMKKVSSVCLNKIIPNLSLFLKTKQEKFGYITVDPKVFLRSAGPSTDILITRVIPYLITKTFPSESIYWLYFDGFINRDLEQIIKSKYSDRIMYSGNKTYLRILPDENFGFIYDLMDDIYSTC